MIKRLFILSALAGFLFAETAVLAPTQSGKLTHSFSCCGFNIYYDAPDETFWIGDCNYNVFGCVSSSLAGVWRWDLSEFEGAEIHSASVEFSAQSSYCSGGADVSYGPITGSMNTSQALGLHNSPPQSTSSSFYSGVNVNSYVIADAVDAGSLGAHVYTDGSCAMDNSGGYAPMLTIVYTPDDGILGDVNDSGSVDVSDVVLAVNIALGLMPFNDAADLNDDGEVNVIDVVNIVNIILGT